MLWSQKKLSNLEQRRRPRKFTSSYWVVSSRVVLEYFLPAKAEQLCPRLCFLVPSQNVEKGATNVVASKETTKTRTTLEVLKVRIQLLGGLISSSVRV